MIKDDAYYARLDLDECGKSIRSLGERRGSDEVFQDVITAIVLRSQQESITAETLKRYLGEPDEVSCNGEIEIWRYRWIGKHGGNPYSSETPFKLNNGVVEGLWREPVA